MEQNGKRLLTLINQLLDLSKMESGQYKLQYKKGSILNETGMLVQSFHSYAEQHGISLTLNQTENAQTLLSDNQFIYRSEEHTSELQSRPHLVCRLLLEKKKYNTLQLSHHF